MPRTAIALLCLLVIPKILHAQYNAEVSGFHPGMTPQEVHSAMKSGYHEVPAKFTTPELTGFSMRKGSPGASDIFFFTFFNGTLTGVSRHREFPKADEPLLSQIMADAKAKYGTPYPYDRGHERLWVYEGGRPKTPVKVNYAIPGCPPILSGNMAGQNDPDLQHARGSFGYLMPQGNGYCATMDVVWMSSYVDTSNTALVQILEQAVFNETPVHEFLLKKQQEHQNQLQQQNEAAKTHKAPL